MKSTVKPKVLENIMQFKFLLPISKGDVRPTSNISAPGGHSKVAKASEPRSYNEISTFTKFQKGKTGTNEKRISRQNRDKKIRIEKD